MMDDGGRAEEALAFVRAPAMALSGVTERLSHGEPTWFAPNGRSFAIFSTYHHGGRLAIWMAVPEDTTEFLVKASPSEYFVPPYVGTRGWIGMYLDVPIAPDEVQTHLGEAYRAVMQKKR